MAQPKPDRVSLDKILHLVDQLTPEEREQLRLKLNRQVPPNAAQHFMDYRIDIDALAAQQGVPESTSIEALKGDFWPEEEDLSEFIATLRQWRQESTERT